MIDSDHCPICQSPLLSAGSTLDVCGRCGLAHTRHVTSNGRDQDYSPPSAEARARRAAYFMHFICRDLRPLDPRGLALDVGCADGLFLDLLEDAGWQARGIEPFMGLYGYDQRIVHLPLEEWSEDGLFDLITMVHALEHMDNPQRALLKIRQLLRPSGTLFIAVPNYGGIWSRLCGDAWPWLNLREHYYHYTDTALRSLLTQAGFTVTNLRTSSHEAPSVLTDLLVAAGVFRRSYPGKRIITSLLFRGSTLLRRPTNILTDYLGRGAELIVVARLYNCQPTDGDTQQCPIV